MENNKIKGIVKTVSEKNKGLFILIEGNTNGVWWNGINVEVTKDMKGKEVELTIMDQEKRKFSYLTVLNSKNVECNEKQISTDEERIRSVCLSYSKDLAVAGKIEIKDIKTHASIFLSFIKDGK